MISWNIEAKTWTGCAKADRAPCGRLVVQNYINNFWMALFGQVHTWSG